jgi:glutathione S-transferase
MILYGSSLSPFVRKTIVYMTEKGVDFELVPTQAGGEAFKQASPFGKVPALKDGDFTISDSTAIITYLEAIKPEPNLIPTDPKARARTIWYEEYGDTLVAACSGTMFFNRVVSPKFFGRPGDLAAADEAQKTAFPRVADYLESVAPASGDLVEDRFTLADIAVASPFATAMHAGCPIEARTHPKAAAYIARILERPSFARLIAEETKALTPEPA